MHWHVIHVFWLHLFFLEATEESLLSSGKVLDNSQSCGWIDDFIVVLTEVEARLVPVS